MAFDFSRDIVRKSRRLQLVDSKSALTNRMVALICHGARAVRTDGFCCLFSNARGKIATWLILPVVIRSSQRLSHACLSINILL